MLLATGEINGHGGALFLMPTGNTAAAGQVDAVQSSGAGGVSFVDFIDLTLARRRRCQPLCCAGEPGEYQRGGRMKIGHATQPIAIGHAEGVTVSGDYLYLADGPHGVSVWKIADGLTPIDDLHLVANTLQSEYPTTGINVIAYTPCIQGRLRQRPDQGLRDEPESGHASCRCVGRYQRQCNGGCARTAERLRRYLRTQH